MSFDMIDFYLRRWLSLFFSQELQVIVKWDVVFKFDGQMIGNYFSFVDEYPKLISEPQWLTDKNLDFCW